MSYRLLPLCAGIGLTLLLALCGCEQRTTESQPSAAGSQPSALPSADAIPDSLLVDSVAVALNRLADARSPTPTDSATVRRWADSLAATGNSLRGSQPNRSRKYLGLALQVRRNLADDENVAVLLGDIGVTYFFQSRYEEAISKFREALEASRDTGLRKETAANLNNIGLIHRIQGRYERALVRYRASLAVERELDNQQGVASTLNNIGSVHLSRGQYEDALEEYRRALAMHRDLGYQSGIADVLNNLGIIHREQGRYEQALSRYQASLAIKREEEDQRGIAHTVNNIGLVYMDQGHAERALRQFRRALTLNRDIGRRQGIVYNLDNIGDVHLDQGRLGPATDTLAQAVRLAEKLRLSATSPEARRSLLAAQIESYRSLTTAHVRSGRPDAALRSLERARARVLAEHLAGTARSDTTFSIPPSVTLRGTLGREEAALLYTNVGPDRPLTVLAATSDTVYARELPDAEGQVGFERAYEDHLPRLRQRDGSHTAVFDGERSPHDAEGLATAVRLYRSELTGKTGTSAQRDLGQRLHELLVAPIEEHIRSQKTLIVVPTGVLSFLPFETLRDSTGRYLVETKHVRYAQSLTVLRQLQGRRYSASRRPLLAVGGAAYRGERTEGRRPLLASARRGSTHVASEEQASAVFRSAERRIEEGRTPRPAYQQLGYKTFASLYGTKLEVQKLGQALGGGTSLLTGRAASEEQLRRMSRTGTLEQYRYLHFATHGIAVPEAPQLSALVLSQRSASDSVAARDGYLTMREIAGLQLNADVAVLSACRTGLGRIVAGEGVVNLSHAFLRAGANATLVSQWRVLDWSTQQFMTAVYREAAADDVSFAEATTEVKRRFINGQFGPRNENPLRWAPFVFYGRE